MNTLEKLTNNIEEVEKIAHLNLDELPSSVRSGWTSRVTDAQGELKKLLEQYKTTLLQNSVAIFLTGDTAKAAEFSKLIRDENEGLTVDAGALYERLTAAVEETYGDREREGVEWGIAQMNRLQVALQEVMHEVGLKELPMPATDSLPFLTGHAEILGHVRSLIRNACGDALNGLYLEVQAVNAARSIRYIEGMVPVAISNATEDEVNGLSRSFLKGVSVLPLNSTDEINKEFLIKSYKDINKKIRNKNAKKSDDTNKE